MDAQEGDAVSTFLVVETDPSCLGVRHRASLERVVTRGRLLRLPDGVRGGLGAACASDVIRATLPAGEPAVGDLAVAEARADGRQIDFTRRPWDVQDARAERHRGLGVGRLLPSHQSVPPSRREGRPLLLPGDLKGAGVARRPRVSHGPVSTSSSTDTPGSWAVDGTTGQGQLPMLALGDRDASGCFTAESGRTHAKRPSFRGARRVEVPLEGARKRGTGDRRARWSRCVALITAVDRAEAEADGNRTRQEARHPLNGFEDRGTHQASGRLRRQGSNDAGVAVTNPASTASGSADQPPSRPD